MWGAGRVGRGLTIVSLVTGASTVVRTIDVLAQRDEVLPLPRQLGERIVRRVWLCLERHVPSVAVELPYQARIPLEGFGCC
jgi:hypothetical protein